MGGAHAHTDRRSVLEPAPTAPVRRPGRPTDAHRPRSVARGVLRGACVLGAQSNAGRKGLINTDCQ